MRTTRTSFEATQFPPGSPFATTETFFNFNRYQFDEQGGLVRLESDGDVTTSVITYDEAGNRLREEIDEVGETSVRIYAYDCF